MRNDYSPALGIIFLVENSFITASLKTKTSVPRFIFSRSSSEIERKQVCIFLFSV